uniref:Uncharacterized protein n=1 Tax=Glossina palpalis gambiensis TaxID=67801 RepID=A0A1B0BD83_9MUSC
MQYLNGQFATDFAKNQTKTTSYLGPTPSRRYQDILKIPTSLSQFSTSLGPIVDGHVIPDQPYKVMGQYTEHFSRYDLLFGITESESYHSLGVAILEEGLRENERDNLLRFYMQSRFDIRPDLALAATLKK